MDVKRSLVLHLRSDDRRVLQKLRPREIADAFEDVVELDLQRVGGDQREDQVVDDALLPRELRVGQVALDAEALADVSLDVLRQLRQLHAVQVLLAAVDESDQRVHVDEDGDAFDDFRRVRLLLDLQGPHAGVEVGSGERQLLRLRLQHLNRHIRQVVHHVHAQWGDRLRRGVTRAIIQRRC